MKAETDRLIAFAREMLGRADKMLAIGLSDDAGRACYLACFHVAQAVIFEREGRMLKTHRGVQTEFNRIMKDDPRADAKLVGFLARAYNFKTVADYGFDAHAHPSQDQTREALREAGRFFGTFTALLSQAPPRANP